MGKAARKFWQNGRNHKEFFDTFASKCNIKIPNDWGQVPLFSIKQNGGKFIDKYYKGSLVQALSLHYPEEKWKSNWFRTRGFWQEKTNQKKFFDDLGETLLIKKPSDWGKVTWNSVVARGGSTILTYYGGSIKKALEKIKWNAKWFVNVHPFKSSFWNSLENQRNFLQDVAEKFNIHNPNDWKRVTHSLLLKQGGKGLIAKYNYSLSSALTSILFLKDNSSFFKSTSETKTAKKLISLFQK